LDIDFSLALGALHRGNITKSLDSQNITEVNPCLILTSWAWSVYNFVIGKDELLSYRNRSVVDERGTKSCQNERVDTNDWFNNFETDANPDNTEDGADREVEEVVTEVIRLVGDFADTSI
jgi:hypothetical protein